jgi:hypothetical protein
MYAQKYMPAYMHMPARVTSFSTIFAKFGKKNFTFFFKTKVLIHLWHKASVV